MVILQPAEGYTSTNSRTFLPKIWTIRILPAPICLSAKLTRQDHSLHIIPQYSQHDLHKILKPVV
ncbi:hypothetical protein KFK09_029008 [Dendrobium nobile]|uniref:Uncharacterized protein n=1 Tax=Dendrobium nobile TaxID=94219 RepID=A0A8T3A495_DENNO|nr:hypothetical protein KFK09_029008 [Dendrobium nobile]